MVYVNISDASARSDALRSCSEVDGRVTAAVPGETENLQLHTHFHFLPLTQYGLKNVHLKCKL